MPSLRMCQVVCCLSCCAATWQICLKNISSKLETLKKKLAEEKESLQDYKKNHSEVNGPVKNVQNQFEESLYDLLKAQKGVVK